MGAGGVQGGASIEEVPDVTRTLPDRSTIAVNESPAARMLLVSVQVPESGS
jgi:hypothetical protein